MSPVARLTPTLRAAGAWAPAGSVTTMISSGASAEARSAASHAASVAGRSVAGTIALTRSGGGPCAG